MVAFIASLLALVVLTAIPFVYGKRRPVGTPLTWAEAMLAAMYLFAVMFVAYGVVPHQFLDWADRSLRWRADAIGIPAGPLHEIMGRSTENHWYSFSKNALWPEGITFFGRGRLSVTKQAVRDMLAAGLYIVFLGVHIAVWGAWQKRGKKAAAKAGIAVEASSSSYGRPLVKKL